MAESADRIFLNNFSSQGVAAKLDVHGSIMQFFLVLEFCLHGNLGDFLKVSENLDAFATVSSQMKYIFLPRTLKNLMQTCQRENICCYKLVLNGN